MKPLLTLLVASSLATASSAEPFPVAHPADFAWKPKEALPPGAFGAVLRGDPTKGPYDLVAKFPAHFTVPLHSHTSEIVVVMLDGAITINVPGEKPVTIEKGGLFVLPPRLAYTAHCEDACQWLAHGERAFDIIYSNPKDDPRKK